MSGIFIREGMTVSMPLFSLSIGENGELSADIEMNLHVDVGPIWLAIALNNLEAARSRAEEARAMWRSGPDSQKGGCLDRELEASMQAVVASATAIESLFANVSEALNAPKSRRGPRYKQVSSLFANGFELDERCVAELETNLAKVYSLRNEAVHPTGAPGSILLRPDIGVGVERRFAVFCFDVAKKVVGWTMTMFCDFVVKDIKHDRLRLYVQGLRASVIQLLPRARGLCAESNCDVGDAKK